jgi:3-deoxy-7-phosphoheptulonate synthase
MQEPPTNPSMTLPLISPERIRQDIPLSAADRDFVSQSRKHIKAILDGKDPRLLVLVGPCSIHHTEGAKRYARALKGLADELADKLFIVMRAYFQKPRTLDGWQGMLMDPHLDGSSDIAYGIRQARELAQEWTQMQIPLGLELVDGLSLHYLADCISWGAIGARTVESSLHRQLASGVDFPIGFKNNTEGNIQGAIYALKTAQKPQSYIDMSLQGSVCLRKTRGNPWGHIILRGGRQGPNYSETSIHTALQALKHGGLAPKLMIDCGHGNSTKLGLCSSEVLEQILDTLPLYPEIMGLMIESYLEEGKQSFSRADARLNPNLSITDPCLGWEKTAYFLRKMASIRPKTSS